MSQYHYHPDGVILVRANGGQYTDTLANFELDYGGPAPVLPEGIAEVIYDDGGRHALLDIMGNQRGTGPIPYFEGDAIIAAYDFLTAAKEARVAAQIRASMFASPATGEIPKTAPSVL